MDTFTIMVVSSTMQDNYEVKVNENGFLIFDSRRYYDKIVEVEKMLYKLVNEVIKGKESENYFEISFLIIESFVNKNSLTKVNIIESNEDLDDPFEIMFPTLVYFFMTNHEVEGYTNYNLFYKKIQEINMVKSFKRLRKIIRKAIEVS